MEYSTEARVGSMGHVAAYLVDGICKYMEDEEAGFQDHLSEVAMGFYDFRRAAQAEYKRSLSYNKFSDEDNLWEAGFAGLDEYVMHQFDYK